MTTSTRPAPGRFAPLAGNNGPVAPAEKPVSHLHGAASYLPQVLPIFEKLSALLGRPLRVLDLGLDPAYFAHHLGARGATVTTATPGALAAGENYDLVLSLGTSLLAEPVDRPMLEALSRSSAVLLADSSAIEAAHSILTGVFAFAHDLPPAGRNQHPICFASNRYWLLGGTMAAFDRCFAEAHPILGGVHLGTRHHYVGSGTIAKTYNLNQPAIGAANRIEWERETLYLRHVPPGLTAAALILSGEHNGESWLVRHYIEGRTLLELIDDRVSYDPAVILRDVLTELAVLEHAGLYHSDVRTWNVIVRPDGRATLIDYGSIVREARSCSAPYNPFASFMIFAHEVYARTSFWRDGHHLPKFRLDLPEPFGGALRAMVIKPPAEWNFAGLLRDLDAPTAAPANAPLPGLDTLLAAADECHDALNKHGTGRPWQVQQEALAAAAQREAELRQRADLADATLASMQASTSWRVTAPLRALGRVIRRMTGRP